MDPRSETSRMMGWGDSENDVVIVDSTVIPVVYKAGTYREPFPESKN